METYSKENCNYCGVESLSYYCKKCSDEHFSDHPSPMKKVYIESEDINNFKYADIENKRISCTGWWVLDGGWQVDGPGQFISYIPESQHNIAIEALKKMAAHGSDMATDALDKLGVKYAPDLVIREVEVEL